MQSMLTSGAVAGNRSRIDVVERSAETVRSRGQLSHLPRAGLRLTSLHPSGCIRPRCVTGVNPDARYCGGKAPPLTGCGAIGTEKAERLHPGSVRAPAGLQRWETDAEYNSGAGSGVAQE
jgi:hypothetical protein